MVEDPNETAQHAFGEPISPSVAPAPVAPSARATGSLAEWGTRAAAFVLDTLFLVGVSFVIAIGVMLAIGASDDEQIRLIAYVIGIPISLLYAPLLMARRGDANGQTIGKQMMDIRVVRLDGERVTFWTGVTRQIVGQQLLLTITLYVYAPFDYLWPLRDARNQALHDKIASTLVVRTNAPLVLSRDEPAQPSPRGVDETTVHGWLPPSAG